MQRVLVSLILVGLVAAAGTNGAASAEGPYRGKVIDAATKEPLVGAVVLVYWNRESPGIGHGPSESFLGAEEALTDAQGEFVVAKNPPQTWTPGTWRSKPHMTIFYPGYGYFPRYFSTKPALPADFKSLLKIMAESAVVFELPRLGTREERLLVATMAKPITVPWDHIPNFIRLLNQERQNLYLPPLIDSK